MSLPTVEDRMKVLGTSVQEKGAIEGPLLYGPVSEIKIYYIKTNRVLLRFTVPCGFKVATQLAPVVARLVASVWSVR